MKKYPNVWMLHDLLRSTANISALIDGKYVPCRPVGWPSLVSRIRLAAMVFTGRADALIWPGDQ